MPKFDNIGISNISVGFAKSEQGSSIFNQELRNYAMANRHNFDSATIAALSSSIPGYLATLPSLTINNESELLNFMKGVDRATADF